ncbi:M48 family metallopeptidase [Puniceicoccaceae bacterium K14]|nr:M48 family metallopeptidase [Puniceicoccaceae bacterium K14]
MNLVSESEVVRMSMASFEQMKAQLAISYDPEYNEMMQRVGHKISQEVFWDVPLAEWEFVIFDAPQVNAFAMPGGKVGIYTGLFQIVKTEDELASVLAHEIAHVSARHTHERISQAMIAEAGNTTLGVVGLMSVGSLATSGIMSIYNVGATGAVAAWDRKKESEADEIGMIYMARAGYNPEAAITVMERMVQLDGGSSDPWYSTHPSSSERLDAMHGVLEEAVEEYEKAKEFQF